MKFFQPHLYIFGGEISEDPIFRNSIDEYPILRNSTWPGRAEMIFYSQQHDLNSLSICQASYKSNLTRSNFIQIVPQICQASHKWILNLEDVWNRIPK